MHVHLNGNIIAARYSKMLLNNGNREFENGKDVINITTSILRQDELIISIYSEISTFSEKPSEWLQERIILASKYGLASSLMNRFSVCFVLTQKQISL